MADDVLSTIYASCFETGGGNMRFFSSLPPFFTKDHVLCCFTETDVRYPLCPHCFGWFSCLPFLFLTFIHLLTLMIIYLLPSTLSLCFSYIWKSRLDYSKRIRSLSCCSKLPPRGTSYLYYQSFSDLWWIQVPCSVIVLGGGGILNSDNEGPPCWAIIWEQLED